MKIEDFENKYGTKKPGLVRCELHHMDGSSEIVNETGEEFEAELGDLIKDYSEHLSKKPKWYRSGLEKLDWNFVEERFRKALNVLSVTWNDFRIGR